MRLATGFIKKKIEANNKFLSIQEYYVVCPESIRIIFFWYEIHEVSLYEVYMKFFFLFIWSWLDFWLAKILQW